MQSNESLREFVESASRTIDRLYRRQRSIEGGMWLARTRGGEELAFPTTLPDKDAECVLVRSLFELRDVVRYVFINEAWMVAAWSKDPTPEQRAKAQEAARIGASNHPDREEVVMFAAEDTAEGSLMACRRIVREPGKRPFLAPLQFDPRGGQLAGRFLGLLPTPSKRLQ